MLIDLISVVPVRMPQDFYQHSSGILVLLPKLTFEAQLYHPINSRVCQAIEKMVPETSLNDPQSLRPGNPLHEFLFVFLRLEMRSGDLQGVE
jgi:hypothetical protein